VVSLESNEARRHGGHGGITSAEDKIVLSSQRVRVSEKSTEGKLLRLRRPQHESAIIAEIGTGGLKLDELINAGIRSMRLPGFCPTSSRAAGPRRHSPLGSRECVPGRGDGRLGTVMSTLRASAVSLARSWLQRAARAATAYCCAGAAAGDAGVNGHGANTL